MKVLKATLTAGQAYDGCFGDLIGAEAQTHDLVCFSLEMPPLPCSTRHFEYSLSPKTCLLQGVPFQTVASNGGC